MGLGEETLLKSGSRKTNFSSDCTCGAHVDLGHGAWEFSRGENLRFFLVFFDIHDGKIAMVVCVILSDAVTPLDSI